MEPVDALLAAAYELSSPDDNRALYARWADTYESGFIVDSRYVYHDQVAKVFATHGLFAIDASDAIVDIGCGTGLAGAAIRRLRPLAIDGIDISPEMLRQAAAKRHDDVLVYRALIEADLTQALTIADDAYAGAVSVGTFTHGHVGPAALDEVVRIVRAGGHVAIGINAAHYTATNFSDALRRLADGGAIANVELTTAPIYDGADSDDLDNVAQIATFEIV
ncbi:MAG TPA: class I SAM-dependent methyltransferase [Ilumatobacteraceae bacterium]|nr:class I SAM-dependent methyltransferase [Ilumatobacteraceae bacterium]